MTDGRNPSTQNVVEKIWFADPCAAIFIASPIRPTQNVSHAPVKGTICRAKAASKRENSVGRCQK